jgi:hypothetical protein
MIEDRKALRKQIGQIAEAIAQKTFPLRGDACVSNKALLKKTDAELVEYASNHSGVTVRMLKEHLAQCDRNGDRNLTLLDWRKLKGRISANAREQRIADHLAGKRKLSARDQRYLGR